MGVFQSLKIIGTISLGLLTGTLISIPLVTAPALLSLPSSTAASKAYDVTSIRLQRLTTALSSVAFGVYTSTLIFASRKHPYLVYLGILSAATGLWSVRGRLRRRTVEDGFEYLDAENAEVVKDRILGLKDWVAAGLSGVSFVIAVVGGWGERFAD